MVRIVIRSRVLMILTSLAGFSSLAFASLDVEHMESPGTIAMMCVPIVYHLCHQGNREYHDDEFHMFFAASTLP